MPPQARLGDKALIPADAHGCPACPHTATGPAVAGSRNVLVNDRPAIRVGDPGIHAACCGPNTWNAKTGSGSVLINGRAAHRLGDLSRHCGGSGRTIEGSSNVIVGDNSVSTSHHSSDSRTRTDSASISLLLLINSMPAKGAVISLNGCEEKITSEQGYVNFINVEEGQATIRISSREVWAGQIRYGEKKQIKITLPIMSFGCSTKQFRLR